MPFKSKSQQRYLFAKEPEVAEEFAKETPKKAYKKLPEKVDEPKRVNPSEPHLRDRDGLMKISKQQRNK